VSIEWTDTNGHNEAMLHNVEYTRDNGPLRDQAFVSAVFDGGGGAANPARFEANATCLDLSRP
jgi:hypothetical protein